MANFTSQEIVEASVRPFNTWATWKIDYPLLGRILASNRATSTNAEGLESLMVLLAPALNVPVDALRITTAIECGWPSRTTYRATMPRDPGTNKNDNNYIGVTQASQDFWTDISRKFKANGLSISRTAAGSTLATQLAAPFVYIDLYRDSHHPKDKSKTTPQEWPLSPALIYSFHQQSFTGLRTKFKPAVAAGSQSGVSLRVLDVAYREHRSGRRVSL